MTDNSNYLILSYSDSKLRVLVEEYITQQKKEFTFQSVCAYIAYWAMEERNAFYESNKLQPVDEQRVGCILDAIVTDGRIAKVADDESRFERP